MLDHSIPLHSGYAFRTRAIIDQQRARGWDTCHVTSPKHREYTGPEEEVDGLRFFRTAGPNGLAHLLPGIREVAITKALEARLGEVAKREKPDVLHAHSPSLNGIAALRVGRRLGLPVVYEVRAFWEDAAVDH